MQRSRDAVVGILAELQAISAVPSANVPVTTGLQLLVRMAIARKAARPAAALTSRVQISQICAAAGQVTAASSPH